MKSNDVPTMIEITGRDPGGEDEGEALVDFDVGDTTDALVLAKELYSKSTDWFDSSMRSQLVRNQYNFQSKHPPGSKYHSQEYARRAKGFRPKTRTIVRHHDAAALKAFFSTNKVARVSPSDDTNPLSVASARLHQSLLDQHVRKSFPWLLTCIGGYQDAQVQGVVISKQYWDYGSRYFNGRLVTDAPNIDLIPLENMRFDPASDWRDVVNSSPYLIQLVPMVAGDILDMMSEGRFETHSLGALLSASRRDYDSVRRAREQGRAESEEVMPGGEYEIIWAREYTYRDAEGDKNFWTVGDTILLRDPYLIKDVYNHGVRPYTIGFCNVETHKTIPTAPVQMLENLQASANDTANLRMDALRLAALKRFKYVRGRSVDLDAMRSGVPGGGIGMTNLRDVEMLEHRDVNNSAYMEQDRINVDIDDLAGAMSAGTVQSNRQLNETVGGMQMIGNSYDLISDFQLTIFGHTWVAPTIYQIVQLIRVNEIDERRLRMAMAQTNEYQEILRMEGAEIFSQDLLVDIDVGAGGTSPQSRIQNLMLGVQTTAQLPGMAHRLNSDEVSDEIFGELGYSDASRFYVPAEKAGQPPPSEDVMKIQAQVQMKEMELKYKAMELHTQVQLSLAQLGVKKETDVEKMRVDVTKHLEVMKLGYERLMSDLAMQSKELAHAKNEGEGRGI